MAGRAGARCLCGHAVLEQHRGKCDMSFLNRLFRRRPPEAAANFGRNDLCWCGSGKKYKKCHYESDKEYFSRSLKAACKGPA